MITPKKRVTKIKKKNPTTVEDALDHFGLRVPLASKPNDRTFVETMNELYSRRSKCVLSLLNSLQHLSRERQFVVICSFIPLDELEEMTKFQAEHER